jgi:triosephosphate isomerase
MRRPIIAGNWKMNKNTGEAIELANAIKRALFEEQACDIVLCPPHTALGDVAETIQDSNIALSAQNCHWEDSGAYTGEVSVLMLKDLGCKYIIVGHSERRQYFGEDNQTVNKKVKAVLKEGLLPIMCIGERLEERESGKTFDVVRDHIEGGLKDISADDILKIIIAYEPVWAIGTGKTATPEQAEEVHKFIREKLSELYSGEIAALVRIQYGGSVKPENIEKLMKEPDIDGALVGGASLKADSFVKIVKGSIQ